MSAAHFICEEGTGKKMEGDIETLAIQDLKKGTRPEQFLADPQYKQDGNYDMVVRDSEGNLKHIVASNTDAGARQIQKFFKAGGNKPINVKIGQHDYKLLAMDDGLGTTPAKGSA
ncbi:MAG: hypothetical protein Q7T03_04215 [Deltaproteobacteria bacterium]|nr:hypothetical protein [Deltaproteobacteria bacterium]